MPKKPQSRLPRAARFALRGLLPRSEYESLSGCYETDYVKLRRREGRGAANRWLAWQLGKAAPLFFRDRLRGETAVLSHLFKIALRSLRRQKGYTFINLGGLALGLTCCLLIFLWVRFEWNWDRFHEHREEISRVVVYWPLGSGNGWTWRTPPPLAEALRSEIPEIRNSSRFYRVEGILVEQGDTRFKETIGFTDGSLFEIFTLPLRRSGSGPLLEDPQSLALTVSAARKFFGEDDPLGRTLVVDDHLTFRVAAVLEDIPANSCLHCPILIPFRHLESVTGYGQIDDWGDFGFNTFVRVEKTADRAAVNEKLRDYLDFKWEEPDNETGLFLQPLTSMHLHELGGGGAIIFVWIFSVIAAAVLLIACFNYMNLATARAAVRAREIGVRKVAGATRGRLIQQFLGESLVLSLTALALSLALAGTLAPRVAKLAEIPEGTRLMDPALIPAALLIAAVTGLISGSYPAFFLSAFPPGEMLKGPRKTGSPLFRRILVVFQFAVSVILLIGVLVISRQIDFISNRPLGFNKQQVVYIPLNDDLKGRLETVRRELLRSPGIRSACAVSNYLGRNPMWSTSGVTWEGRDSDAGFNMSLMYIDADFAETFQLKMAEGRFFSREFQDNRTGFVLNRTAVREMGVDNPLELEVSMAEWKGRIIGVVEDFHFQPLRSPIRPLALISDPLYFRYLAVRIDPQGIPASMARIEEVFKQFSPRYPFEFRFLDEVLEEAYRAEQRSRRLLRIFGFMAGFISCLGLFGLASYTAQRRTKEIGVRKVLGASGRGIFLMLSRSFLRWVLAANLIAWPIAYLLMRRWLQNFAYRAPIGWTNFAAAGLISLLVAFLTVCWQAVKSSRTDPARSLRYE